MQLRFAGTDRNSQHVSDFLVTVAIHRLQDDHVARAFRQSRKRAFDVHRISVKTGAVKEWASPSGPTSQPYGITVWKDIVWYSESAVKPNTLVRFDPKTEKFQTWAIPSGGGVVRNMMATREGNLALACSGVNRTAT